VNYEKGIDSFNHWSYLVVGSGIACAGEKASQGIVDLTNSTLVKFGTDPIIVEQ